jgi:uncharacterized protein YjiK
LRRARALSLIFSAVAGATACRESSQASAAQVKATERTRDQELERRIAKADANPTKKMTAVAMWMMPSELREISGIALTADGRLLAHGDEVARIYVLNPRTGVVLKRFTVGNGPAGDFEGITVAGSDIYLLSSNGTLYQFKEGANEASVPYSTIDTRLGKECEFEGVAFEPDSAWLLLPCKRASKKLPPGQLIIYRWRLGSADSTRLTMLTVPIAQVVGSNDWKGLHPSDITIDPTTGNYVLISSHEKALVEITPGGEVERSEDLPGKHHQPEGVAITKDNILIVSDEATKTPAAITLYRWRP